MRYYINIGTNLGDREANIEAALAALRHSDGCSVAEVSHAVTSAAWGYESGNDFLISIDGGINYPNVQPCVRRGANMFVTGIYTVYHQPDGIYSACKRFEREMALGLEQQEE